jgi:ABC-type lipoprotein export system ATPase subunit
MALLEMRGVARRYVGPPAVEALRGVDLSVARGSYVAIKGPSGSGKSTLLSILGLLDRPDVGLYTIGGKSVAGLSARDTDELRAHTFGFVFQAAHMIDSWSVAANVSLPLRTQGTPRHLRGPAIADALDVVGLAHRAQSDARNLSGGEKQRAAIARAVVAKPAVLLADEPTGNLDSVNADAVLDLFDAIHRSGVTVVVITHDDRVAERAQFCLNVRDGYVTSEDGRVATG